MCFDYNSLHDGKNGLIVVNSMPYSSLCPKFIAPTYAFKRPQQKLFSKSSDKHHHGIFTSTWILYMISYKYTNYISKVARKLFELCCCNKTTWFKRQCVSIHWQLECLLKGLFSLNQRKHQSPALLALCEGNHWWQVDNLTKESTPMNSYSCIS